MMTSCSHHLDVWCVDCVEAYAEERVIEEKVKMFEGEDCCVAALEHDMYLKGRAEALEEAAKVAEKWIDDESTPPYQRKGGEIAKVIRALKDKAAER